jgi:hypothetical protein
MLTSKPDVAGAGRAVPGVVRALGAVALVFGLATLWAGGRVLFGPEAVRAAAGQVVPFVLWGNFLAGFGYLAAGVGLARGRRGAVALATAIAAFTGLLALGFGAHVLAGGAYEPRTAWALLFRTALWVAISFGAWRRLGRVPGTS